MRLVKALKEEQLKRLYDDRAIYEELEGLLPPPSFLPLRERSKDRSAAALVRLLLRRNDADINDLQHEVSFLKGYCK